MKSGFDLLVNISIGSVFLDSKAHSYTNNVGKQKMICL